MESIMQFDVGVLTWVQETLRTEWLTMLMKIITMMGEHGIFWIMVCLTLITFKKTRRIGIICAISLAFTFICCNLVIKPIVDRPRPWEVYSVIEPLMKDPGDASFPSGHTANAMGPAWALFLSTYENKKSRIMGCLAVALAFLIGMSRIYLGMHYPTDVMSALILGVICATIVCHAVRKYEVSHGISRKEK